MECLLYVDDFIALLKHFGNRKAVIFITQKIFPHRGRIVPKMDNLNMREYYR